MKTGLNLNGLDAVLGNMRTWGEAVQEGAREAVIETLDDVYHIAYGLCPVRSGFLRDSLDVFFDPEQIAGTVEALAPYAIYPELGTRRMPAQPYLYPAWKQGQVLLLQRLKRAVLV